MRERFVTIVLEAILTTSSLGKVLVTDINITKISASFRYNKIILKITNYCHVRQLVTALKLPA